MMLNESVSSFPSISTPSPRIFILRTASCNGSILVSCTSVDPSQPKSLDSKNQQELSAAPYHQESRKSTPETEEGRDEQREQ
eukprot:scaffold6219_cov153-Pinguiococcus_pyrenoidosus.AAC.1